MSFNSRIGTTDRLNPAHRCPTAKGKRETTPPSRSHTLRSTGYVEIRANDPSTARPGVHAATELAIAGTELEGAIRASGKLIGLAPCAKGGLSLATLMGPPG